jgi:hypothetical protein
LTLLTSPGRSWLGVAIICLGAFGFGWAAGGRSVVDSSAVRPENWSIPEWSLPSPGVDQALLAKRNPWGVAAEVQAPTAAQAKTVARETMIGLINNEKASLVVVVVEGRTRPEYRALGDGFADGSKIVAIGPTSVTLEKDGATSTKSLYRLGEKPAR